MDGDVTIFTGVARSGTTMLGAIAQQYLDVAAVNEGPFEFWLADRFRQDAIPDDDAALRQVLIKLVKHDYFQILLKSRQTAGVHSSAAAIDRLMELAQPRTVQGLAMAVLRFTSEVKQLPRLGHEDPMLISDLPKMLRIFPAAKIVHIIRDPRDVTASVLQFPWGPNNAVVAALQWADQVRTARRIGGELGPNRYVEVRYQNFLQSPRDELSKLMTFVCGTVDAERLNAFVDQMGANPLRNNVDTWREELTMDQVRRIESACGEQMIEFGFSRATTAPPLTRSERWYWRVHHRMIQLVNISRGQLQADGKAIFEPGPERKTAAKIQRLLRETPGVPAADHSGRQHS